MWNFQLSGYAAYRGVGPKELLDGSGQKGGNELQRIARQEESACRGGAGWALDVSNRGYTHRQCAPLIGTNHTARGFEPAPISWAGIYRTGVRDQANGQVQEIRQGGHTNTSAPAHHLFVCV
jgi:hypothetical protein